MENRFTTEGYIGSAGAPWYIVRIQRIDYSPLHGATIPIYNGKGSREDG